MSIDWGGGVGWGRLVTLIQGFVDFFLIHLGKKNGISAPQKESMKTSGTERFQRANEFSSADTKQTRLLSWLAWCHDCMNFEDS